MPSRRLDDRIRELCVQVVNAPENHKEEIIRQLQSAISEKIGRLRTMTARKLLGGGNNHRDRRSAASNGHGAPIS